MGFAKLTFVLGDFTLGSPGQQLLDRFLMGYFDDGEFRRPPDLRVTYWIEPPPHASLADAPPALKIRQRDFGLVRAGNLAEAVFDADAIVVAPSPGRVVVDESSLANVLGQAPKGSRCFVHGCLPVGDAAQRSIALAEARGVALTAGTSMSTAVRLPEVEVTESAPIREALIVVQGTGPQAELAAIDGLMPILGHRRGGETGLDAIRRIEGREIWRAGESGEWSWALLAAALARSNTAQGSPQRDGRTQDLAGQDLVRKLARHPRGWMLRHRDGLRTAILVLDGVVADCNFAVLIGEREILSAQIYRPPAPNRCEFDLLAAALEKFFRGKAGREPEWSMAMARFMDEVVS